jgi:uncharacterized membrane protein YfcA
MLSGGLSCAESPLTGASNGSTEKSRTPDIFTSKIRQSDLPKTKRRKAAFETLPFPFYILLSLWSQAFNEAIMKYESYYVIGFFQTGLSVIVGTTGQLTVTKLLKEFQDKNKVVATSAILMCITHILKIIVFIYFGFVFRDYLDVVLSMAIGSILGSYIGTHVRDKIDGKKLIFILKIFLSLLAAKSILSVITPLY